MIKNDINNYINSYTRSIRKDINNYHNGSIPKYLYDVLTLRFDIKKLNTDCIIENDTFLID